MALQALDKLIAVDVIPINASDSANISADTSGNPKGYQSCFLHNVSAGATVRVLFASQLDSETPRTIYIAQGDVFPAAIKRVYATTPAPPAGLLGLIAR